MFFLKLSAKKKGLLWEKVNNRNLDFFFDDKEEEKNFLQRKIVYCDKRWTIEFFYDKEEAKKF
jgi:hypothetical protein